MASTEEFRRPAQYESASALDEAMAAAGARLPVETDVSLLAQAVRYGPCRIPNRIVAQPMEGSDCTEDGTPTDLTLRKYLRFAAGGSGLIWFEACAVVPEGRANPRQMMLHEGNVDAIARMVRLARETAAEAMGHTIVCVLQLTHSGRFSRPRGKAEPILAHHSDVMDPIHDLPPEYPLISDEALDELQNAYAKSSRLAAEVGFDGVDIKACHGYLISGLLGSHTRPGRYGGSFDNRTRMLRETARKVLAAVGDRMLVTTRMNVFDAIDWPFGWGATAEQPAGEDAEEAVRLVGELTALGVGGINVSIGAPRYDPRVNRPGGRPARRKEQTPTETLVAGQRIIHAGRDLQLAWPGVPVIASGLSWLGQWSGHVAAGLVRLNWATLVGWGRGVLAYPDFARDLVRDGRMDPAKVCVMCGACAEMLGRCPSGCVAQDGETYGPIYGELMGR